MSELILGFGKSPIRRSVYVNRQYPNCIWYFWDGQNNTHIPIVETDLFCFIDSISVRENEFKGKAVEKIEVNVSADHPYRLVAGIETAFARSFVSALLAPFDFAQPVAIVVQAGDEEGVVFGRVRQEGVDTRELPQLRSTDEVKAAIDQINARIHGGVPVKSLGSPNKGRIAAMLAHGQSAPAWPVSASMAAPFAMVCLASSGRSILTRMRRWNAYGMLCLSIGPLSSPSGNTNTIG